MQRVYPDLGLMYFDGDVDLQTPTTSRSGILDSMGVAHLLGQGAQELTHLGPRHPMLSPGKLALFGFDPAELDTIEFDRLRETGVSTWSSEVIAGQPGAVAAEAWASLASHTDQILVHFDVDAIDSTDLPLANFPHFNLGQSFDSAMSCLAAFCRNPQFTGLVLTEVNPDHDIDGTMLRRLVDGLLKALSASS